jgi:hypothetical protein
VVGLPLLHVEGYDVKGYDDHVEGCDDPPPTLTA